MFVGDDPSILVDVIQNGSHVAATINTTTTRVDGNSALPTVTAIGTGNYKISFPSLSPAPAEGDELIVKVNGDIGGTAWSEAVYKLKVLPIVPNAVWDELFSGHNVSSSFGKIVRQIYEGVISTDGQVDDTGATATTFITNLTETTDGFYHDKVIVFTSGDLTGQARHIETYVGSTKAISVSQGFTSAPADTDEFLILSTHEHSLAEIAGAVWNESLASHSGVSGSVAERLSKIVYVGQSFTYTKDSNPAHTQDVTIT